MTITVVQNRPLLQQGNDFYSFNPVDIEKYIKLSDHLIYLASAQIVSDESKVCLYKKIAYHNVSVRIVEKRPLKDIFGLSKRTKEIVLKAIQEADIVVIKVPSMTLGRWAYNKAVKMRKICLIEVIGCAWDSYWYHSIKGKMLAPMNFWVTKRMVASADHVLYVTQSFLQRRYPNCYHNVGCSNVVLLPKDEKVLLERMNKIESAKMTKLKIGTAGAVNIPFKGQEYVIRALKKLKEKGIVCDYYLAGGGSCERLKLIASKIGVLEQVHFLGAVPKKYMGDFYRSLDLYIHPSLAEGLPRVLIEAESYGLPALGAKAAGTPELLDKNCVFKKKSVKSIIASIMSLNKEIMKEQAVINFERAKEYMPDELESRRKRFFEEMLEKKINRR